jgi:hypothetical protein
VRQRRQPIPDHSALAFVEVPALEIGREHEAERIVAEVRFGPHLCAGRNARAVTVSAIEN